MKAVTKYKEQKDKKYITLNEQKYLQERKEIDPDEEEKKITEVLSSPSGKDKIEHDFYLDEILAIAIDLINQQHVAQSP